MSQKVIVTLLKGIEALSPLLDELPESEYTLLHANEKDFSSVLKKNVSYIQSDMESAFVVVLSKKAYFKEEEQREVAKVLTSSGIKAEPVFLVVHKGFTWKDIDYIVQHNHLFYTLPDNREHLLNPASMNYFRGFIDKAMLDYSLNRKLIELISTEFISFIEKEQLRNTKEEVEQMNMELESKNKIDELTQLLNRKGIIEYFQMAKGRATRERWRLKAQSLQLQSEETGDNMPDGDIEDFFGQLSCMMIDIDNFKKINDTYGHLVGDQVLRRLGSLFHEDGIFRKEDVCGRFGGEEFIVILPATNAAHAFIPAEKLRKAIKKIAFTSADKEEFQVTISLGVSELEESEESIEELISKADIALYEAKQTGKDKTVLFDSDRMSSTAAQKVNSK